jgi:hypothetical protein
MVFQAQDQLEARVLRRCRANRVLGKLEAAGDCVARRALSGSEYDFRTLAENIQGSVLVVVRFFVVGLVVIVLFCLCIPATDLVDCVVERVGGRRFTNGVALLLRDLSPRSSTVGPTRKSL